MSVVLRGVSGNQADVDATGALKIQGTFSATVTAVEESVGATSIAIPASATLIGGPDAGGLLRTPTVLNTTPVGTEYALLVRQVGSTGGGLTNAELRATPVPVSLGSTTITGNIAVTGPLTDTQLRASAIPVSLTSTTITGSVAVTGTFFQALQNVSFKDSLNQDIVFLNTVPNGTEMAVPVRQIGGANGLIDPNNTTTTPLAANGVFQGNATDCLGVTSISFSASSDVISAVQGIKMQWSADGINWSNRGSTQLPATRTGQDEATDLVVRIHDRYFRIEYTNGATPQTFFRLQTLLNNYIVTGDGKGVDQVPASGDDVMLVKAVISGKNTIGDGTYLDAKVNPAGFLAVGGVGSPADNELNSNNCIEAIAHNSYFNGTTWDRARGTIANGALVDVSRISGSVAVTGTFWQATQPVSLSAAVTVSQGTAANLRTQTSSESAIGAAVPTNATLTGGSDGINLRALKVDPDGRIVTLQLSDTPSVTRVATSAVSAQLLAANATRKGVIVVNESSGVMYLKFGIAASATSYTYRLVANAVCEIAFGYTGRIDAILNTGTGNAQITELT